jgi:hypothetical protein
MAKKKKKRRGRRGSAPVGVDVDEQRRERLEARRLAKAQAEAARRRRERRESYIRRAGLIAIAFAVVWFLFLRGPGVPSEILGHPIEEFSVTLTTAESHTNQEVQYESTPPVAGPHNPAPAPCGVYGEPVPNEVLTNERMVHTLEHGAVGILYDPALDPPQQIADIESIVSDFDSHVFSAPYPEMETPVAVIAWEHMMRLDDLDRPAVREFIDEFREGGTAPERVDCPNSVDQSFTETLTPSPSPSPTAEEERRRKNEEARPSP